jgi:hypothetical protein
MTALIPNGKQQFCDAAGTSLALGSVAFYVPGTLTPKDTWKDAAQSSLNTNPVDLDADGRAVIFGTGDYRQIVMDRDGNTIWDQIVSAPLVSGDAAGIIASAVIATTAATAIQVAQAAASALAASNSASAAALAAAMAGVYAIGAASNVPKGLTGAAIANAGSGMTNAVDQVVTWAGGNMVGNPIVWFDVVAGALSNVRIKNPGLYIGSAITLPTPTIPGAAGGAALTLTSGFLIGNGQGYWVQSADTLTLDRYKNVAGVATADTAIQSIPTEPALEAAVASLANFPIPLNADNLADLVQHPFTATPYNADGTVSVTTGTTFRIDTMTPALLAARIAGTQVTFIVEVVSGTLTTASIREYTLPNGQFGGGTATTTVMALGGGRYSLTKALVGTDQSIDVFLVASGTAVVRPLGSVVGGVPARSIQDPTLFTAQSLASNAANDPSDIAYTAVITQINTGSPTLVNGVLSLPNGSNGSIDYIFPKALVDGDTGVAYFSIDVPPGNILTVGTRYDVSGGGSADASIPTPVIEKIGPTDYRVVFQVLAATPGLIFYSLRLVFVQTYAITRNISGARFFKGATLPRVMAVPKVISDAITTATQAESDAGSLIRRFTILADSVFQSTTISFTPASVYLQTYLGSRARVRNLAVPGSGLRAMLAMGAISSAPPSTGPIVTIASNQIPASGSVQITAWTGDPVTAFYKVNPEVSMVTYLRGVKMILRPTAFDGNFFPTTMYLDRVTPGPVMPCPAGSQLISEQAFQMRDDFGMLEGSINPSNPTMTVLQGAAAFFAARDAISPAAHSLFMPNLIAVPSTTPVTQNPGHSNTAALVGLYGATRILDLNASGIPSGNFLTTDEAAMLAAAGFSPNSTDNAYMALGWRPPGLAQSDHYHPNDLCSLLIGYRIAMCAGVQSYMENIV